MIVLSIIIPTYNAAKTLRPCLDSILNQRFSDFEILLVDGLSNDDTVGIAKSYCDSRIKITAEKDQGIYDAMNKGIKMASGNWLYFLGSDDRLYEKNTLQKVFEQQLDDYMVVYGDVISTRFNGRYDGVFSPEKLLYKNICHQAIFFRKQVFNTTGYFKPQYKGFADWEHNWIWMVNPGITKQYINQVIAEYADGGYSSVRPDEAFFLNREKRFLQLAGSNISKDLRSRIYFDLAVQSRSAGHKIAAWLYKMQYWRLRVWLKFL